MKTLFGLSWRLALIFSVIGGIFVGAKLLDVRAEVHRVRDLALSKYEGDLVLALSQLVDDPTNSYHERNYAIGMLANLSDRRALPVLKKHWNGSRNASCGGGHWWLCQYELSKAVARSKEDKGPGLITMVMQQPGPLDRN